MGVLISLNDEGLCRVCVHSERQKISKVLTNVSKVSVSLTWYGF